MYKNKIVTSFGIIEIGIGLVTLIAVGISVFLGISRKPPEVLLFVGLASAISLILGIGIILRSPASYHWIIFFAKAVILSKILIFTRIIILSGALETFVPQSVKNVASLVYHSILIWYFSLAKVKKEFNLKNILHS